MKWMRDCDWFEAEPLDRIQKRGSVLHANYGINQLTSRLHMPHHRFYVKQFFRCGGEEAEYEIDMDK